MTISLINIIAVWVSFQLDSRRLISRYFLSLYYSLHLHRTYFDYSFFWRVRSQCVTVDNQGQMASPVWMACRVPLGRLAVMDVTEPKEIRATRERLGPRGQLVQKERKDIKESLEPRVPPAKKDSEERKVRVELQDRLSFPRTWTGKNAPGKRVITKTQVWSRQVVNGTSLLCIEHGSVIKQLLDEVEHDIMNYQNRGLCYLRKPKYEADTKCETFHMKIGSACFFIFLQINVIFIRMVSHLDSLWNRGKTELGSGLLLGTFVLGPFNNLLKCSTRPVSVPSHGKGKDLNWSSGVL